MNIKLKILTTVSIIYIVYFYCINVSIFIYSKYMNDTIHKHFLLFMFVYINTPMVIFFLSNLVFNFFLRFESFRSRLIIKWLKLNIYAKFRKNWIYAIYIIPGACISVFNLFGESVMIWTSDSFDWQIIYVIYMTTTVCIAYFILSIVILIIIGYIPIGIYKCMSDSCKEADLYEI